MSTMETKERGQVRCQTCWKVHDLHATGTGKPRSWADPEDGHVYRPESWEDVAYRYGYSPLHERETCGVA